MTSWPDLRRAFIICLGLLYAIDCSGVYFSRNLYLREGLAGVFRLRDNPVKFETFNEIIVPWLEEKGVHPSEIAGLNYLDSIQKLGPYSSSGPRIPELFKNTDLVFELCAKLLENGLDETAMNLLYFSYSSLFHSSTHSLLIHALSLDSTSVFDLALRVWFTEKSDIIGCLNTFVCFRLGEDYVLEMIEILWERLQPIKVSDGNGRMVIDPKEKKEFESGMFRLLRASMFNHYVSVFEDILERIPQFLLHIRNSRDPIDPTTTMIHRLCHNLTPTSINRPPRSCPGDGYESFSFPLDFRTRSYPSANSDLLLIMLRHGARIDSLDSNQMTPLFLAIEVGNEHIVKILLKYGADPTVTYKNQNIFTFLDSCKYNTEHMRATLIKHIRKSEQRK